MIRRWLAALLALGCRSIRIAGNVVEEVLLLDDSPDVAVGSPRMSASKGSTSWTTRSSPSPASQRRRHAHRADRIGGVCSSGRCPASSRCSTIGDKLYISRRSPSTRGGPSGPSAPGSGARQPARRRRRRSRRVRRDEWFVHVRREPLHARRPGRGVSRRRHPDGRARRRDARPERKPDAVAPLNDAQVAIDANVSGSTITGERAITALGNITAGQIRLNGRPLPPPWAPLNIRTS